MSDDDTRRPKRGNGSNGRSNGDGDDAREVPGVPFTQGNPYRWRPGQSGNPRGLQVRADKLSKYERMRPSITDEILEYWEKPCDVKPFGGLGLTWGQVWIRALFVNGIRGRGTAIRELHERVWGKVPLAIKLAPPPERTEDNVLANMTDEELEQLEQVEAEASDRERAILEAAERRLNGDVIDVEAESVEDEQ